MAVINPLMVSDAVVTWIGVLSTIVLLPPAMSDGEKVTVPPAATAALSEPVPESFVFVTMIALAWFAKSNPAKRAMIGIPFRRLVFKSDLIKREFSK